MMGMTPLSLETLREELCPRLSTEDLFAALANGSRGDARNRSDRGRTHSVQGHTRERVLVLDVRPKEEYLEGE